MSYIQNLYTSRDNNAQGNTFVGQEGRLWWNPDTNAFYYSDGNTVGGIAVGLASGGNATFDVITANVINAGAEIVQGNIVIASSATLGNLVITDQTIAGNVANRSIILDPAGNGIVELLAPLNVHATGNLELEPELLVDSNGQTTIRVPAADDNQGALEIIGSTSGAVVPLGNPGGMIHITGQNNLPSRLYNDGISNYPLYVGRRFNGTAAAPTGVLLNQVVSRLGANPYLTNADEFTPLGFAKIDFVATENQTTTAQGSKVQIYTTPDGANTQVITATFQPEGIDLGGNLIPTVNNLYQLGNNDLKWSSLHIGPDSIFIEDEVLGTDAELTVSNGVLLINGTQEIQIGNMQMTTTGISYIAADSGANLIVGAGTNTGYMEVDMVGIKFRDNTLQTTAGIPLTQRGNALGVATLDGSGKVPAAQLPAGATIYLGAWDAANNTPTLADGTGSAGDEYSVSVGGTVNLGSGNISFTAGDFVIYSGTVWQQIPTAVGVTSFNTRTGAVTLTSGDVTNALSAGSIVNSKLANPAWTLTTGQGIGLTGSGTVALGNSITLTNTGVIAAIAGTGVTVSAATGNVTFSIGQAVGTASTVQFAAISSTTTIQATGNITGGNLATGGRIVATGNIETSGYLKTPNTSINNGVVTTGNISGGNLAMTGAGTFGTTLGVTGNITGGNILDSKGDVRSIPVNTQNTGYTLVAADAGKIINMTTGNVTVPAGVFATPFGQAITIYNGQNASNAIVQGSGVTMRLAGTASTGNRTLARYGLATVVCVAANTFVISGAGLT
jgi:hypothetical protein